MCADMCLCHDVIFVPYVGCVTLCFTGVPYVGCVILLCFTSVPYVGCVTLRFTGVLYEGCVTQCFTGVPYVGCVILVLCVPICGNVCPVTARELLRQSNTGKVCLCTCLLLIPTASLLGHFACTQIDL